MIHNSPSTRRRRRTNTVGLYLLCLLVVLGIAGILQLAFGGEPAEGTPSAPPSTPPAEETQTESASPSPLPNVAPPSATAVAAMGELGSALSPAVFYESLSQGAAVTFASTPDWERLGTQEVRLLLTGPDGQTTHLLTTLTLWKDSKPPVFEGVRNLTVEQGEEIDYKDGVTITDDKDAHPKFTVDSSAVKPDTLGAYPVTYTSTDSHGNTTAITVTLTVTALDMAKLAALADQVLAEILTAEMTPAQQVKAIYDFSMTRLQKNAIANRGALPDRDMAAYTGLRDRKGDSYTRARVSEALFDRLGITYIPVERMGGSTPHYWSLVNLGEGYYHFDAMPHDKKYNTCMITEARAQEIAAVRGDSYYTYDVTLLPEPVK